MRAGSETAGAAAVPGGGGAAAVTGGAGGVAGLLTACLMLAGLAGLGLATLVDMLDGPGDARAEREAATPALPVTLDALLHFPGAARYYAAERYALKDAFIALNSQVKIGLFGHSPYPNVLPGRDGMLFLGTEAALDATLGVAPAAVASDAAWQAHFAAVGAAFAAREGDFVFLLGPDKRGVYRDALPDWVVRAMPARPRAAGVLERAAAVLDPAPVDAARLFAEARAEAPELPLYHRTDTHWTELGAALAVDAALAPLGLGAAGAVVAAEETGPGGDLARMIGWRERLRETTPVLARPPGLRCETPQGEAVALVTIDPLPTRRFRCTHPGGRSGRVLVFMDSFGMPAAPRLTQIFGDVTFVWQDRLDLGLVDALGADLTIQILVERKLQTVDPATLLRAAAP
jgi:hypothetical protein